MTRIKDKNGKTYVLKPGANLSKGNFRGYDFKGIDLSGVNFADAMLRDAEFQGADLENAVFDDADLRDADMSDSNLTNARLDGANVKNTVFRGATVIDIDTDGALNLDKAIGFAIDKIKGIKVSRRGFLKTAPHLYGAVKADTKPKKSKYPIINGHELKPGTTIERANFASSDLDGLNLSEIKFIRCNFKGASMKGVNLKKSTLDDCNLSNADLEKAILTESNIKHSIMFKVNLTSADLSKSILDDVDIINSIFNDTEIDEIEITNSDMENIEIRNMEPHYVYMKKVNMKNVDFSHIRTNTLQLYDCDLVLCKFNGSNLVSLSVQKSTFNKCTFERARIGFNERSDIDDSDFFNTSFKSAYVGSLDIDRCNFKNVNFSGIEASYKLHFYDCNLGNADFRNSKLNWDVFSGDENKIEGANFEGSNYPPPEITPEQRKAILKQFSQFGKDLADFMDKKSKGIK